MSCSSSPALSGASARESRSATLGCEAGPLCSMCTSNSLVGGMNCSSCRTKGCSQCVGPYQADSGDGRGARLRLLCSRCLSKLIPTDVRRLPFLTGVREAGTQPSSLLKHLKKKRADRAASFPGINVRCVETCPNCAFEASDYHQCSLCRRRTCFKCTEPHRVGRKKAAPVCSSCLADVRERDAAAKRLAKTRSRFSTKRNSRSSAMDYFTCSLDDIMTYQRDVLGDDARVPSFLTYLMACAVERGAWSTEGIFRLNTANSKVLAGQAHLNSALHKQWELPPGDAHVPVAILKRWLRDMPRPLLDDYEAVMRAEEGGEAGLYARVVEGLSEARRDTLLALLEFLGEASKHEEATKMTRQNLAIVFSQCLTRNPSESAADMLKNQPREQAFMEELMRLHEEGALGERK